MKLLVTGGLGFIGSNFIIKLLTENEDFQVINVDAEIYGSEKRNLEPLGKIVSWASCGVDPALMGSGPIPSTYKALKIANWNIKDLDLFEINEAFASQSLAVIKELKIPKEIVNVNGGAIALGHPIGASGSRIVVTLLHEMKKRGSKKGLATLCIGGGMGIAMCLERD